jgi:hypothetical protein
MTINKFIKIIKFPGVALIYIKYIYKYEKEVKNGRFYSGSEFKRRTCKSITQVHPITCPVMNFKV